MKPADQQERIAQIRKRAEIAEVDTRELKRTKPLEKSFIRKTLEWLGRSPEDEEGYHEREKRRIAASSHDELLQLRRACGRDPAC